MTRGSPLTVSRSVGSSKPYREPSGPSTRTFLPIMMRLVLSTAYSIFLSILKSICNVRVMVVRVISPFLPWPSTPWLVTRTYGAPAINSYLSRKYGPSGFGSNPPPPSGMDVSAIGRTRRVPNASISGRVASAGSRTSVCTSARWALKTASITPVGSVPSV